MLKRIAATAILLLSGCTANAQTRPAYIDVNALMRQHPLYGTLAQYDRQISALEGTLRTRFANADATITNASRAISLDMHNVVGRYNRQPAMSDSVMLRNRSTAEPGEAGIEQQIANTYAEQHVALQGTAQADMARFRVALAGEQRDAYAAFVNSVNNRTRQALFFRAQELHERESNLLLELARQHSGERMTLRARLQTLILSDATRARYYQRLRVLQAQENSLLANAHAQDETTLQSYATQLRARAERDIAQMSAQLQSGSARNLAARERVLQSQTSAAAALPISPAPAATGTLADMQSQYDALVNSQQPNAAAFTGARDDLIAAWNALRAANDADVGHTRSQIDNLRHDREAVRKRMVAQIMYEAGKIAKTRGYSDVTASRAPGAPDLTSLVSTDLKSLTP